MRSKLGNVFSDIMALVTAILCVYTIFLLVIFTILVTNASKTSVTTKDNGIKTIEYGQEIAFDESAPEVSDIVFVSDTDADADTDVHFYRVSNIIVYEGFEEYLCQDDMGNERVLNSTSDDIHKVLKEGTIKYFLMMHGTTLVMASVIFCVLAIWIYVIVKKPIEPKDEKFPCS